MPGTSRPGARSHRLLAIHTLMVAASLGVAAGAAEVAVRLTAPLEYHPLVPSPERGLFWRYDDRLGWAHRPGAEGRFRKPGLFDTTVTINAAGFRGRDHDAARLPGISRVVVIGDSITWGYGVEDDEVFTRLLERADPAVEWINLGVSGYATDQESLLLEREAIRYSPDVVLAEVCDNDFDGNVRDQVYHIYPKPLFRLRDGELDLTNVPVPKALPADRILLELETRSYLWRFLRLRPVSKDLIDAALRGLRRVGLSRVAPPPGAPGDSERLTLALLARTQAIAEAAGARLALFIVPPMPEARRQLVAGFGGEHGVPVLDLHAVFAEARSRPGSPPLFFWRDQHWTPAGHRVVAEAVGRWLGSSGLLAN